MDRAYMLVTSVGGNMLSSMVAIILTADQGNSSVQTAMTLVAGRPLAMTINTLACQGIQQFVIVVGKRDEQIKQYLARTYQSLELQIKVVDQPTSLNDSLSVVREVQQWAGDGPQLIVRGNTIIRDALCFDKDFLLSFPVDDRVPWCFATQKDDGTLDRLYEKPDHPPSRTKPPHLALIGVYYLQDVVLWRKCIEEVYAGEERGEPSYQGKEYGISSALERYNKERPIEVRQADEWFDLGNIDNYVAARRALIQSRCANHLSINEFGVLRKKSDNFEDLQHEIDWYLNIPRSVYPLVPRIFGYSKSVKNTYIDLEFIPLPTLAEVYLYDNIPPKVWQSTITKILDMWYKVFFCHTYIKYENRRDVTDHTFSMYWEKTRKRLQDVLQYSDTSVVDLIQRERIYFNQKELPSWLTLAPEVEKFLGDISEECHWSLIHGDFHFGNILWDFHTGLLKLIDPRGAFGTRGIYGDACYDLAKFLHSFHGGYAHLSAGMFTLRRQGSDKYELDCYGGVDRSHLFDIFRQWLDTKHISINLYQLILIEGMLFLSMLPLHTEDPARQKAAYLTGLDLVTEALDGLKRRQGPFRVCVDLDGTICELAQHGDYDSVQPKQGAREALYTLKQQGAYIIIYTARRMRTHNGNITKVVTDIGTLTRNWLTRNSIPYDELIFGKPYAQVYIDDLAYKFETWEGLVARVPREVNRA